MMCHTSARFQVIYLLWTSTCSEGLIAQNTLWYQARGVSCFISREFHQRLCTVSFFFPMGRQSRCSGCKELKSACDFGRPEKYCTGPGRSDNEQADPAEVEELTNTESIPPTDAISFHYYLHYCGIFLAQFLLKIDRNIISSLQYSLLTLRASWLVWSMYRFYQRN